MVVFRGDDYKRFGEVHKPVKRLWMFFMRLLIDCERNCQWVDDIEDEFSIAHNLFRGPSGYLVAEAPIAGAAVNQSNSYCFVHDFSSPRVELLLKRAYNLKLT